MGDFCDQGYACPKDGNKAMEWFRRAAEQGDVMGMDKLGYAYLYGRNVEVDFAEAATWLIKAADLGSADSSFYIGHMLRLGLGVTPNLGKASQWMLSASEKNHAGAQYTLGRMYADGLAVNREEAIKWMTKSAELGDEDAKEWMEELGLGQQQA